ncbi:MAG TPA: LLM class F420-dependent oxidoreductase [Candidatus Binataceae bacterium]|nr:LLM class F420-dependent oxidoreductase [Candidatus Binataceae bacterium]
MKIGLFALGFGTGSSPEVIRAVAVGAEKAGVATLWVGEHVVLFDQHQSKYPYSPEGRFPAPANVDWLDPFIALTYAAALTSRIRLATGICLVPEHNPLVLAKEIASLDRVSGGRFAFGVGIGWLAEEFAALGIPFERRAQRTREYLDVIRHLWSDEATTYHGEFVRFDAARCYPKPAQGAKIPIFFGGESGPALKRTADIGDGWFGFNLGPRDAAQKIERLRAMLSANQRDPAKVELIVAPYSVRITTDDLARYRDAGVHEVVMVTNAPADASRVPSWIDSFTREWVEPAARL